jgi:hypothetical protein
VFDAIARVVVGPIPPRLCGEYGGGTVPDGIGIGSE